MKLVDVVAVLRTLEQFGLVRLARQRDEWYTMYCPFHADGQEKKPSFGVALHDSYRNGQLTPAGWAHCFACGYVNSLQGMIQDILKNRSISASADEWLAANVPGYVPESESVSLLPPELMNALTSKMAIADIQSRMQQSQSFISEEELASYRYTVPYMYERRLTDEIIAKYDVGVDMNWVPPGRKNPVPCITFPVRDRQGRTLFFCRRSIKGKLYNYPEGVEKPVYGVDMLPEGCRSVIICESIINALTAETYGYDAVALMGTGNSLQIQQLKELGVDEFVLCMDGDDAGRKAAERLKRQLKSVAIIWVIDMPDGKDLNDCDKSTFDQLYLERN